MADYIDRQAAVEKTLKDPVGKMLADRYNLIGFLEGLPPADVRENVRGEWIPVTNGRGGSECNQCHAYAPTYQNGTEYNSNFCPNCGADMRGEKDGE